MYIDGMPMRATRGRRNQLCLQNEALSDVSVDGTTLSSESAIHVSYSISGCDLEM